MRRRTTKVPTIPHSPPTTVAATRPRTKNSYRKGSSRKLITRQRGLQAGGRVVVVSPLWVAVLIGDVAKHAELVGDHGQIAISHDDHLGAVRRLQHSRREHAGRWSI